MEKILTVPSAVVDEVVFVTGNHYISLPHIAQDGSIVSISHLSKAGGALVEHTGNPLIQLTLNDKPLYAQCAEYKHSFIPTFHTNADDIDFDWNIFAPEGIRGFVVRVSLCAKIAQTVTLALEYKNISLLRSIFHSRTLQAQAAYSIDSWTGAAAAEFTIGFGVSSLAMSGGLGFNAEALQEGLRVNQTSELKENVATILEFYIALGTEQDGACLANMDMRRRGKTLFSSHTALLDARAYHVSDAVLEQRLNLNLNFCYYFSIGYPLDAQELMLTTSKSSRYYVSGAYWARDSFLWAFPAILRIDKQLARQALLAAFTTYLREGANHALYLNGANLYPGFELDELVAPLIALKRYVEQTGDNTLTENLHIKQGTQFILSALQNWKDAKLGLYKTELNPSDDPVQAPCLIYNNALVLAALRFCNGRFADTTFLCNSLQSNLDKHSSIQVEHKNVYAWAVDGNTAELYDDPPGSLLLMPYYGWPDKHCETYQNTLQQYFSAQNPYFYQNGVIIGQGCEHANAPWPMSLCNLLLVNVTDKKPLLAALRAMSMDNGIACETVYPHTGKVNTGAAFATFAGFYANAIIEAYEHEN